MRRYSHGAMDFPESLAEFVVPRRHRFDTWAAVLAARNVRSIAEVGVWRGEFAEAMLSRCPKISSYHMIDAWRRLEDWNKPANVSDVTFEQHYEEALRRTDRWKKKRVVHRGTTQEVAAEIADGSLDFVYLDGDHSLRGISIDLHLMWPKVRAGGMLGGDDFTPWMRQHDPSFEPSGVFPFAAYFAEAVDSPIEALPRNQFVIHKLSSTGYSFSDHVGRYRDLTVRTALRRRNPGGRADQPGDGGA
jgi:hypothetical protein